MYRGRRSLLLVTFVLLQSLPVLAQSAPAQPNLRIAYTGGLFGYYRQDVVDSGKADGRRTAPSLLLDALAAESNPTPPLLLGMGDNFAPEYGASLLWAGHAPAACQPPAAASSAPYPEALYKTDLTLYTSAACDNIAAFLMQAGYRALVPGKEDFIYGSVWLEHMALLLARESGPNKATSSQFANQDHTLELLAANLRLQLTTNDAKSKQFTVGTKTVCPLLLSEPSTWGSAGGCQSGEARPEEGAVLKDVGYTRTILGGGSNTVLIGVVGSEILDAVSTQNKTFCGVASGSAPHLTGYTSASCQAATGFKAKVIVTDPLEAVTSAMNAALASGPVHSIIVMAQMRRGDAEELAAKLQAFAKFDPKYRKIVLVISGAYAAQSSGGFSLSMKGELSQIPVLTPHPAYDTDNLSYQQFPLVQPLSTADLTLNGSYELVSQSESAPLPLPAARATWSLLLDELERLQSMPAAAVSSAKSRSCDAQRFYPAPLTRVSSSLHQLPIDARDAIDNCDVEGMQYLLEAMRGIHPGAADVAVLERRDFFFGLLPQDYVDYNMCSKAGPPESYAAKKCRLNVALDRVLWKGDYLEKVMLKGSDLSAMITASTTQAAQAGESVAILKQLLPSKEAQKHLYALVSSTNFQSQYAYDVLKRLCRDVPDRWLEHCKLLSGHLSRFREETLSNKDSRDRYKRATVALLANIADDVPLEYITSRLTPSHMDSFSAPALRGAWRLVNALFSSTESPFDHRREPVGEDDEYYYRVVIWRKDHPEVITSTDVEEALFYRLFEELPDELEDKAKILSGLTPPVRAHFAELLVSLSSPNYQR